MEKFKDCDTDNWNIIFFLYSCIINPFRTYIALRETSVYCEQSNYLCILFGLIIPPHIPTNSVMHLPCTLDLSIQSSYEVPHTHTA